MSRMNSKLAVVGAGAVGTSLAYAALIRGSADVIALYDIDRAKVEAEVADLAHGTQFTSSIVMGGADISAVKDSNVVVVTAGAKQHPGQSRLDLAETNARILADLLPKLIQQAPEALFVLVTNPCDVLTVVAQRLSGLPRGRVFSTGTMLDTSRLRWMVGRRLNISQRNVHVTIAGEHGDTEFPLWSSATIGEVPLRQWSVDGQKIFTDSYLTELAHEAATAAYRIIEGKGSTNYAIGIAGARLVEALLAPARSILPLSTVLDGQYGIHDVALSLPCVVSAAGVEQVLTPAMDPYETTKLHASADTLRRSLQTIAR
ncbi:L-lactate dehydrogenase [Aestuariimicrobium sp. T2.26MG-19.2B]|uniref:L-lactate dehydrogenase n=1 Tax=Aestuariimicrobium sp. T2.26MG-19.2B TaxID=3040679 RepID=UPI00254028E0|nr:L-lactate dehydrogenase [Aestuariimicrobium sp. T2.26MG-19.2B]